MVFFGHHELRLGNTPQVTFQRPAQAEVSEEAEAINDEMLVDVALDKFGGDGGASGDASSKGSTTAPKAVKTAMAGVAKSLMNHLVRLDLKRHGEQVGRDPLKLEVLVCPETHQIY